MKFSILKVAEFNKVLEAVYELGGEVELCNVNGKLNLIALDPTKSIYSRAIFNNNMFSSIEIEDGFQIKIEVRDVVKVMKTYRDFDELTIELKDNQLEFEGKKKLSKKKLKNSLNILASQSNQIQFMDGFTDESVIKDFLVEIEIEREILKQALSNAELYGRDITFGIESNLINIKTTGIVGSMEYVIENDEFKIENLNPDKFKQFEITFVNKKIQKTIVGDILKLRMSPDLPLSIGTFSEFYDLYFTVAPLVNDDNDE